VICIVCGGPVEDDGYYSSYCGLECEEADERADESGDDDRKDLICSYEEHDKGEPA